MVYTNRLVHYNLESLGGEVLGFSLCHCGTLSAEGFVKFPSRRRMDVAGKVYVNKKDSPALMAFVDNMIFYENPLKRFMQTHCHAMKIFAIIVWKRHWTGRKMLEKWLKVNLVVVLSSLSQTQKYCFRSSA